MRSHRHVTAFYLETLLLIFVFVAVILMLTRVFGFGQAESGEAKLLTNAVCLAQNAAEAVSASDSEERLLALMNEDGNAVISGDAVEARYDPDMRPDGSGVLLVRVTWDDSEGDGLVRSAVQVFGNAGADPVYELNTAVYLGEVRG